MARSTLLLTFGWKPNDPYKASFRLIMKKAATTYQRHYTDDLETDLGSALTAAGIAHFHESECPGQRLDFFLPEDNLYIEIKRYHSPWKSVNFQASQLP